MEGEPKEYAIRQLATGSKVNASLAVCKPTRERVGPRFAASEADFPAIPAIGSTLGHALLQNLRFRL